MAEDVIAVANIMWERPDLIPCTPVVRLSFLAELMLRGIGGFRSKALRKLKYKQVQLSVVRSRKCPSKTEIAATFRIPMVKERQTNRGKRPKWYVTGKPSPFHHTFDPNPPSQDNIHSFLHSCSVHLLGELCHCSRHQSRCLRANASATQP